MSPWSKTVLLALECWKCLLRETVLSIQFHVSCYHSLPHIIINMSSGVSQKDPAASQLWNNPLKHGRWLSWKNKETSKITAQVWKITIETFSALKNTFQNKPIPGEHVVPQTFLSFSHIINLCASRSARPLDSPRGRREGDTRSFSLLIENEILLRQCFSKSETNFTW